MGRVYDTGVNTAEENMRLDAELLEQLKEASEPILHLYDWQGDCATYGYFIKPYELLEESAVEEYGLQIARRPTGGGLVFHHCDFAFSLLVPSSYRHFPNTLECYAFVNRMVIDVVRAFCDDLGLPSLLPSENDCEVDRICRHFCMAKPTIYDVMVDGRKVGGAAQRRTRDGFLHQGTIALTVPPEGFLKAILKGGEPVIRAMQENGYPLLGKGEVSAQTLLGARKRLSQLFEKVFICDIRPLTHP
jgi:lipoate-protein ligase A